MSAAPLRLGLVRLLPKADSLHAMGAGMIVPFFAEQNPSKSKA